MDTIVATLDHLTIASIGRLSECEIPLTIKK